MRSMRESTGKDGENAGREQIDEETNGDLCGGLSVPLGPCKQSRSKGGL